MSEKRPLVSVIMNCYNGEKYLREAIDSVYAQTYTNWEIIFWDNSSTDKSAEIAKSYDKKIKYFRSRENTCLGRARRRATKEAKGDYLAFLDSDDVWLDRKLEKQTDLLLNNDIAVVYGKSNIIYEDESKKEVLAYGGKLYSGMVFKELVCSNFITFSSAIVDRRKFIECGGFPDSYQHSTDYHIFLHLAYKYKVKAIDEVCCKYRIHGSNMFHAMGIICAKENIMSVQYFLPDKRAVIGLRYQYADLFISYVKENQIIDAISILVKYRIFSILLKRILNKYTNLRFFFG